MHDKFLDLATHPFKMRAFMLRKLPSAFFSGVQLRHIDSEKAIVTVPYRWFSTNPFKSTYFACLSMAAEMSTGILAMGHTYKKNPKVSLLVTRIEGNFLKKAKGIATFTCDEGHRIALMVKETLMTGKPTSLTVRSVGVDKYDDIVAEFNITWSFKSKIVPPKDW